MIAALSASAIPASATILQLETSSRLTINVYPTDLSDVNVSADQGRWDSEPETPFVRPSTYGPKWNLDIEGASPGLSAIGLDGLTLSVNNPDQVINSGDETKVRYQYFLGSGGYPTIDSQTPTLNNVLSQRVGWTQTLLSDHEGDYGVVLQMQLEGYLKDGSAARVTVINSPQTGKERGVAESLDFAAPESIWFANTPIYRDGNPAGEEESPATWSSGAPKASILENFGDMKVVSFGPNLGRDLTYVYRIQDFTILGQTFHFTNAVPPVTTPGSPSEDPTVPGISVVEPPVMVITRPPLVASSPRPQTPTATLPSLTTPPPVQTTQARVLADVGANTEELLGRYSAANGGAVPPPVSQVLTIGTTSEANENGHFDAGAPFTASVPWDAENGDQWVDVWGLSSPTYIGTFPVIGGVLQMTNADLSALGDGDHHLVFVGQTSGANQVVAMTLASPVATASPTAIAETPSSLTNGPTIFEQTWIIWLAIVLALIIAGAIVFVRLRRTKSEGQPIA